MSILRNRFLSTSSFLLDPREPTNDGTGAQGDQNGGDDTSGQDDGAQDGAADDTGAQDDSGADDGDSDGDTGGVDEGGDAEDDDPDLADLPPEVRAKAKAAIEKRVARETGWRDRQIDKLHAKRRQAEEDVAAAGAIVNRRADGAAPAPENLTQAQIEDRAKVLATNMTAQQEYDRNANDADARGIAVYKGNWKTTMAKLPKLGGVDINDMVDILNTDKPHVVLYSLADPETYERVMALPPARRRNEFVKLSLKEEPKVKVVQRESQRPGNVTPPVNPVNGGRRTAAAQVNLADDKVADDVWYATRNATRRKKFSAVD